MKTQEFKKELITKNEKTRLHHCSIPIIGLTGGIATGKSTVARLLQKAGLKVINADHLIKSIYTEPQTLFFIEKNWPLAMDQKGAINFKALKELFFNDQQIQKKIEHFLYLKMPEKFKQQICEKDRFVIYDIPLLFEKNLAPLVDYSVCVYCPTELQIPRLMQRDRIDKDYAQKILKTQIPIEKKKIQSDFIIHNHLSKQHLPQELARFLDAILEKDIIS